MSSVNTQGGSSCPAIILPYFGQLPDNFPYWLQSCAANPGFTWILYTDDRRSFVYPANVLVHYCTLQDLRIRFERKLGFDTALNHAYKLCDFKPLYGWLFQEELKGFTHWGCCDVDLLFGRLDKFLTPKLLSSNAKINVLGHLSIYQNRTEVNEAFRDCDYRSILRDRRNRIFDEVRFEPNINRLLSARGLSVCATIPYADIIAEHYAFRLSEYRGGRRIVYLPRCPIVFSWRNGRIVGCLLERGKIVEKEYAYVHFQKRRMSCPTKVLTEYLVVPNRLVPYEDVTPALLRRCSHDSLFYALCKNWQRLRNAWKVRFG